jgi:two-component system, cell cycle response regulator
MRVVLVDPSRTVLKYVTRLLAARNHEVRPFVDGHEALAYAKSDPDVGALITSSELTTMTGVELCWETRLLASCRRPIYVLLMSSNQDRHRLIEALDCGADDFIGKPPVAEELYARLRAAERLASLQRELMRLATTDPLTGVRNRRAFFETAEEACARTAAGGALSAIMLDIDRFKQINDSYGHDVGDNVIRAVANEAAKENSSVGRLGGEEFALLLEGRALSDAVAIAECLRLRIAALLVETGNDAVTPTCSFGVSEWEPGDTIDDLLKRADLALYTAKTCGRNRVAADADPTAMPVNHVSSVVRSAGRRGA